MGSGKIIGSVADVGVDVGVAYSRNNMLKDMKSSRNFINPGIKRKQEAEALQSKQEKILTDGPISLLISYIIDIITDFGRLILNMISGYRLNGSKFIYNMVYKDGSRLIRSDEKYGALISLRPFRIILCILYPPLGVFLSRGFYGLHYVIITVGITYFNLLLGICFSLLIIHIPSYADRFAKYDYYRILTIRQLISNCNNISIDDRKQILPLIIFLSIIIIIIGVLYMFIKYV
jgi:uncharacterized membrane protein YqaE (UPF0057 family)